MKLFQLAVILASTYTAVADNPTPATLSPQCANAQVGAALQCGTATVAVGVAVVAPGAATVATAILTTGACAHSPGPMLGGA